LRSVETQEDKDMSKQKKILFTIIALVLTAGYIAGMSYIVEQIRNPPIAEPFSFGDYYVINANGETDPEDEKSTLYNNINALLRYSADTELNDLKLINLYKMYFDENVTNPSTNETIVLEITDNIAEDESLKLIHMYSNKTIEFVNITVEERTIVNSDGYDEEYFVVVFNINEEGYYGLVSQTGEATYDFVLFILSLLGVTVLFLLLFVLNKSRKNITQSKDTTGIPKELVPEETEGS
jgi:hypothetical protein